MERKAYKPTNLEQEVENRLKRLNINYIPQYSTRSGFILDFAIFPPDGRKIDLEVDGYPWHLSRKTRKKDRFRDYMLKREGWEIIRIGDASSITTSHALSSLFLT